MILYAGMSLFRRLLMAVPTGGKIDETGRAGHLVKDPVCGTYVSEAAAIRSRNHFFCSEECLRKFSA